VWRRAAEAAALATAMQLAATESAVAETAMLTVAAEEPTLLLLAPRDHALAARPEPLTGAEQQVLLALTMMGVAAAAAAAAGEAEAAVALAAERAAMDVAMATMRAEGAAEAVYVQAEHEATCAHLAELLGEGAPPAGPSASNAGTVARGRRAEALCDRALGKCSAAGRRRRRAELEQRGHCGEGAARGDAARSGSRQVLRVRDGGAESARGLGTTLGAL